MAEAEDKALTEVQNAVEVIATTFKEPLGCRCSNSGTSRRNN